MYRFQFEDINRLEAFLASNDVEYVDAIFDGTVARFIMCSVEVYSELKFPVLKSEEQGTLKFRIFKKILQFITIQDIIELQEDQDNITLDFLCRDNGTSRYCCSFVKQIIAETSYADRIALANTLPNTMQINITQLSKIIKLSKTTTGFVSVDSNVASIVTKDGARVYHDVTIPVSFAITAKSFECLRRCNLRVWNYRDYLIANNQNFTVIVKKMRFISNEEYLMLTNKKFGAQFVANIGLSNLFLFLTKAKLNVDKINIDLDMKVCELESMYSNFRIPIAFREIKTTGKLKELEIPDYVLTKLLMQMGTSEFHLRVTRTFVQLTHENFTVVW